MNNIIYLPKCQYGVDDGNYDVDDCGKPAIALIEFDDRSTLYVCEKHLHKINNDSNKE